MNSFKNTVDLIKEQEIKFYTIEHLKNVSINIFIDMFGNYFSYNLLNRCIEDNDYINDLKVIITRETEKHNSKKNIDIFINDEFIENIKLKENDNPIMFYHFQQLKYNNDEN